MLTRNAREQVLCGLFERVAVAEHRWLRVAVAGQIGQHVGDAGDQACRGLEAGRALA